MQVLRIPESLIFSKIAVKVIRTGQDISLNDWRYVKVYKVDNNIYILTYQFYFTGTMLILKCEEKEKQIVITVDKYIQNPLLPTSCNVYLAGKKIFENLNDMGLGQSVIIEKTRLTAPPPPPPSPKPQLYVAPPKKFIPKRIEQVWVEAPKPKVFIGTPIYYTAERTLKQFVEGLNRLDTSMVEDIEHHYVDDSPDPEWHKRIPPGKIKTIVSYNSLAPELNSRIRIKEAQNILRKAFLEGAWDYFLILESDIILNGNELSELLIANADIASGVCGYSRTTFWWGKVDFSHTNPSEFSGKRGLRFKRWIPSDEKTYRFTPITGFAFGLTLFKRKVLEAIQFEHDPRFLDHSDVFFVKRCCELGFSMVGCRDAVPEHLDIGGAKPNY